VPLDLLDRLDVWGAAFSDLEPDVSEDDGDEEPSEEPGGLVMRGA
jgi:hypothetical protein